MSDSSEVYEGSQGLEDFLSAEIKNISIDNGAVLLKFIEESAEVEGTKMYTLVMVGYFPKNLRIIELPRLQEVRIVVGSDKALAQNLCYGAINITSYNS